MTATPNRCPATIELSISESSGSTITTTAGGGVGATAQCDLKRGHAGEHRGTGPDGRPVIWTD